jgi:hypothetical protein
MKTFSFSASPIRAHNWKDIGGIVGLVLDLVFLLFVLVSASAMILIGFIALILDYLTYPFLGLMTLFRPSQGTKTPPTEDVIYPF